MTDIVYKKLLDIVRKERFAIVDGPFGTQLHSDEYTESGIPVIRIKNINRNNNFDDRDLVYISESKFNELERSAVYPGDILLAKTGATIGKLCILPPKIKKGIIASSCSKISVDTNLADPKYVMWYLSTEVGQQQIFSGAGGSTRKSINLDSIKKIRVPLPSLEIQKQIVSQLEKLEKLKEKRELNIQRCDDLIKSIFYDMFGDPIRNEKEWDMKKLGTLCVDNPLYGSGASGINYDGNIRYIRITDINENGSLTDNNIVSPSIIENKYLLEKGDLLFARSGATVGKSYLHNKDNTKYIFAGYLIRFRLNKTICNPKYVESITKTNYYYEWVKNQQTAVAQPNINAKQYSSLNIPVPPIVLQNDFVKRIEKIERLKEKQIKSKNAIDNLFNGLMQKYFYGG